MSRPSGCMISTISACSGESPNIRTLKPCSIVYSSQQALPIWTPVVSSIEDESTHLLDRREPDSQIFSNAHRKRMTHRDNLSHLVELSIDCVECYKDCFGRRSCPSIRMFGIIRKRIVREGRGRDRDQLLTVLVSCGNLLSARTFERCRLISTRREM